MSTNKQQKAMNIKSTLLASNTDRQCKHHITTGSTVEMNDYMKSLVLIKSKAEAKLGSGPSCSCCCSSLNFGPFECFL